MMRIILGLLFSGVEDLPVVGVDGQVAFLPQDAGDGKGLRFALQRHRASCFGFEQSPEDVAGEVRRRG